MAAMAAYEKMNAGINKSAYVLCVFIELFANSMNLGLFGQNLDKIWANADVNIMTFQLYGMCELPACGYAKRNAIPAMWAAFNWPINIIAAQTTSAKNKTNLKNQ